MTSNQEVYLCSTSGFETVLNYERPSRSIIITPQSKNFANPKYFMLEFSTDQKIAKSWKKNTCKQVHLYQPISRTSKRMNNTNKCTYEKLSDEESENYEYDNEEDDKNDMSTKKMKRMTNMIMKMKRIKKKKS
ncbi:hypothetical protein Glove_106g12 [Diversispora epigaea]|uniref:Uncharacterized protein n=1 Tax=Diversispora epigaea TaxID=1348612 RepID=A0A397JBX5_9GLOM|nr:hypothetical protein Glove_106g12 [Diversispora epigaea]